MDDEDTKINLKVYFTVNCNDECSFTKVTLNKVRNTQVSRWGESLTGVKVGHWGTKTDDWLNWLDWNPLFTFSNYSNLSQPTTAHGTYQNNLLLQ